MSLVPSGPRIVGRRDEIAVLGNALDRVLSGHLTIVSVEGEAGIGKSTVLSEGLAAAAARGAQVVSGRAEELERTRPFGVWAEALQLTRASADPRRGAIGDLLTTPAGPDPPITVSSDPGLQFQVVDAVVDLVEDLAHERPLVIGLDDLHWADPASLLTLTVLARRLTESSVAVIACRRPLPSPPELERALAHLGAAGAVALRLDGRADDAVVELVGRIAEAPPDAGLLAEVAGAGGNPLLVTELLAALDGAGAITVRDGRAVMSTAFLPSSLRLPVERHLAFLPDETMAVLRPASVLGTRFAVPDLAVTTGRSVLDLSVVLEPALTARVLVEDGQRLRFRHELLRDAVYAHLPQSVRRGLHREAARSLAAAGASPLTVAEQLSRGAAAGDADAIDGLTGAAREVAPRSPAIAAELLARAIELAEPAGPARDRLLAERATSLWWAGELAAAEDLCRGLLERRRDPDVEQTARICLARVLIMTGRIADALPELERVGHSPEASPGGRAAALGWAGVARGSIGDLDGSEVAARAALAGAERAGDPVVAGVALNSLAAVAEHRGDPYAALAILDDAVDRADRSPSQVGHRYPLHVTRGHVLLELDRLADARATLETGRSIGEHLGTRWALPSYEVFLAVERFLAGDWDDALTGLETGFALAEETGERYSLVFGRSVSAIMHLHRGDLGRAGDALDHADRELSTTGPAFRDDRASWVRALLLEAEGAVDDAFGVLAAAFRRCTDSGRAVELPVLGPDLVRLAIAVGDRACAIRAADAVDLTSGRGIPSWNAAALRCRGLLTADADMLAGAVDTGTDRPLHVALAAEEAAAASTDHATACALLERAFDAFDGLGATRGTDRVEAALRGRGVHRGRRGRRSRPRTGWDSLTPTERRVVALVAEGLSNPQIGDRLYLSRRTVQTHVGHVFGKLGLSSRSELAAAAVRRTP